MRSKENRGEDRESGGTGRQERGEEREIKAMREKRQVVICYMKIKQAIIRER